jgi:hypothetical protein
MASTIRADVYRVIDGERDYQDKLWGQGDANGALSVGEEILLIEQYSAMARAAWARTAAPEIDALDIIRKIAGMTVRCMENHGAIPRSLDKTGLSDLT